MTEENQSGASMTYPVQCGELKINGFICIGGVPCKIIKISVSKTGKHGHAKVHLTAVDIFTGKKYDLVLPSTQNVDVPHVAKAEYTLVDIVDGFLCLMDDSGCMKEDMKLPDNELGQQMSSAIEEDKEIIIVVQKAMGLEQPVAIKHSRD